MAQYRGCIVRSQAGHDAQTLLCVLGQEGEHLLLADGKRRTAARPKRKKLCHVRILDETFEHPAIRKLRSGQSVTDRELRQALAAYRDAVETRFQGGNHAWQKTI